MDRASQARWNNFEYLDVHRDFFEPLITGPTLNPTTSPDPDTLDTDRLVELPPGAMRIP